MGCIYFSVPRKHVFRRTYTIIWKKMTIASGAYPCRPARMWIISSLTCVISTVTETTRTHRTKNSLRTTSVPALRNLIPFCWTTCLCTIIAITVRTPWPDSAIMSQRAKFSTRSLPFIIPTEWRGAAFWTRKYSNNILLFLVLWMKIYWLNYQNKFSDAVFISS